MRGRLGKRSQKKRPVSAEAVKKEERCRGGEGQGRRGEKRPVFYQQGRRRKGGR